MEEKDKDIQHLAEVYNEKLASVILPDMKVEDLLDLVDFYTRNGMDFEAEMYKRIAALEFPTHPDVILMCAHWEADEGNWKGASSISNIMDSTTYDDALFHMEKLIRMMLPDEAYSKMRSTLSPLLELNDYDFLFDSAELFKDFGYMEYALKCLKDIPATYPDYRQTLELSAECYFYLTDFDSSLAQIDKAIDINSFDDYLWAQSALLNYKKKDFNQALDACEYSFAITKENPRAEHIKNVIEWHKNSSFDMAAASYIRQDYTAMIEIGDLHYLKSEYKQAEAEYMAAGYFCPRGNRDRVIIAFKTAICRVMQGRVDSGVDTLLSVLNQGLDIWSLAMELLYVLLKEGYEDRFSRLFGPLIKMDDLSAFRMEQMILALAPFKCYDVASFFWKKVFDSNYEFTAPCLAAVDEAKEYFGV